MPVTIICGVNELKGDAYAGRSIEDVRRELRTPINIADGASVILNGEHHEDPSSVLRQGDTLEFVKASGEKGA